MSLHPELAWLLARRKAEEAQSRISLAPAVREASLERQSRVGTFRARLRKVGRAAPKPATTRRETAGSVGRPSRYDGQDESLTSWPLAAPSTLGSRAAARREARSGPGRRVRWSYRLGLRREPYHHHDSDHLGSGTPGDADHQGHEHVHPSAHGSAGALAAAPRREPASAGAGHDDGCDDSLADRSAARLGCPPHPGYEAGGDPGGGPKRGTRRL